MRGNPSLHLSKLIMTVLTSGDVPKFFAVHTATEGMKDNDSKSEIIIQMITKNQRRAVNDLEIHSSIFSQIDTWSHSCCSCPQKVTNFTLVVGRMELERGTRGGGGRPKYLSVN